MYIHDNNCVILLLILYIEMHPKKERKNTIAFLNIKYVLLNSKQFTTTLYGMYPQIQHLFYLGRQLYSEKTIRKCPYLLRCSTNEDNLISYYSK
jgi:hypothetical protein